MVKFDWIGQQCYINIEGRSIFLNHFPFLCYGGTYRSPENVILEAHGHVHLSPYDMSGKDIQRLQYCFPTQYDVGVDANNFTPISFKELNEKINHQIETGKNQYQVMMESFSKEIN